MMADRSTSLPGQIAVGGVVGGIIGAGTRSPTSAILVLAGLGAVVVLVVVRAVPVRPMPVAVVPQSTSTAPPVRGGYGSHVPCGTTDRTRIPGHLLYGLPLTVSTTNAVWCPRQRHSGRHMYAADELHRLAPAAAQQVAEHRNSAAVAAAAATAGVIAITVTINEPANSQFTAWALSDCETRDLLDKWARWHHLRVGLGVVAAAAAALALNRVWVPRTVAEV
jgi:hypothetical protein